MDADARFEQWYQAINLVEVGNRLRAARLAKGLNYLTVERRLKDAGRFYPGLRIYGLEQGERVPLGDRVVMAHVLLGLAEIYGCQVSDFFMDKPATDEEIRPGREELICGPER